MKKKYNEIQLKKNGLYLLSGITSFDSSKPIQKRISVNHEGLHTPIKT